MTEAPPRTEALDTEGLIAFTQRLVRAPSVNQPERGRSEALAVAVVVEQADAWGWDVLQEEVAPGRPNVIITIDGGLPGPKLLFEGHTDVVTEGDPATWSVDPFGGEIIDGKLYGRGSADMKGGVGALMFAARALQLGGPFPGSIVLAILCDEEEMMIGVHHFIEQGHAEGVDGAIVCEPEGGEVCVTQKGALRLRVDIVGVMAHGAMPHQGKNPISAASRFTEAAREIQADLQATYGDHPQLGLPYVTPTHVDAGSLAQINVIPSSTLLTFDNRTIPGVDHGALMDRFRQVADDIEAELGVDITLSAPVDRPPTETAVEDPVVAAVAAAHAAVTGEEPVYGGVPGSTDGTILWRDAGLPVVVYGPGGKWIAHQKDEYVEVDELITCARVYIEAATRFLGA
jgi:succinyl-diaminopimelate desuccinylase